MRLLVHKTDGSFLAAYVATNESIDLWNVEPDTYVDFTCSPSGNDAFLVLKNATGRHIARRVAGFEPLNFQLYRTAGISWKRRKVSS